MNKIYVHLIFESHTEINRDVSLIRVRDFINEKLQDKFPEYHVEIGDMKVDAPGNHMWIDCDKDDGKTLL